MDVRQANEWFCGGLLAHANPSGKTILDVGCGNGDLVKFIAQNHAPKHIVGMDPLVEAEEKGPNWRVAPGDALQLEFEDESFDLAVSFSTFEHIPDIGKALAEIKRVLKPFGKFYTEFMPIWTSAAGHHFIARDARVWNPEHLRLVPAWGHLYMTYDEMRLHLASQGVEPALMEEMLYFIYRHNNVNRLSRSDLVRSVMGSGMIVRHYEERVSFNRLGMILGDKKSELTEDAVQKIRRTNIDVNDLGVVGMRICLEKFASL